MDMRRSVDQVTMEQADIYSRQGTVSFQKSSSCVKINNNSNNNTSDNDKNNKQNHLKQVM
jgi:hypothetical protein